MIAYRFYKFRVGVCDKKKKQNHVTNIGTELSNALFTNLRRVSTVTFDVSIYLTNNIPKMCFRISDNTQDLIGIKHKMISLN